ncbi:MAG: DUF2382 domain-containing protein [Synechococcales bacterium]|nr:DUF2382 domain-containing protein [Synechococcales bacterium]
MALHKLEKLYPNYRDQFFDGTDVRGLHVYESGTAKQMGTAQTVLVDDAGHFRYLVVDASAQFPGTKVLLPIGYCQFDLDANRVNVAEAALRNRQVRDLPIADDRSTVDDQEEDQIHRFYQPMPSVETSVAVENSLPVEAAGIVERHQVTRQTPPVERKEVIRPVAPPPTPVPAASAPPVPRDRQVSYYDESPDLYRINESSHDRLKLYEERLVADKRRQKAGEVSVSKRVETETAQAAVPIEKEKVVIEVETRHPNPVVNVPEGELFEEGNVAHMDVYGETADIHKEAQVREEVTIRKETEQDVVRAKETLRREELDVNTQGHPSADVQDRRRQR